MKKNTFCLIALVSVILLFTGCVKDKDEPEDTDPTPTQNSSAGFTWTPSGGSAVVASDAYFINAFSNIVATKNTTTIDISLNSLDIGNYVISPSNGIIFEYKTGGSTYAGGSGQVNITAKTGTLLSGNFTTTLTGGSVSSISGKFTDIPQK